MPVITITTEFSFDIEAIEDDVIAREVGRRKELYQRLVDKVLADQPEPKISDFSTDELVDEIESREAEFFPWIDEAYRMIASGRTDDALDLLYRESSQGLAPPSTEKRTASLLQPEGSAHVQN